MLTPAPAEGVGTGPADILLPPTEPVFIETYPVAPHARR